MSSSGAALGNHRLTLENIAARGGSPFTWGDLVDSWKDYLVAKERERLVFVGNGGRNEDELLVVPYSHRFQEGYTQMQYAKIQGFIRGALSEYEDPHLVFLTFSTTTLRPNGDPRPPLDHLDELLEPWNQGVYYELNRVMESDRKRDDWNPREEWEYLYILEPTTDQGRVPGGYAHAHCALVVDGAVEADRFESVITRHLTECDGARGEAHEFEDSIEVKRAEELGNPGAYLFKYLGKSWDTEEMEDYEERFAAQLYDQGRQRFRASNGAQRWMQRDEEESESGDWIFAGVATADQAEDLREFDDLQDFLVATNARGIRSWLSKRRGHQEPDGREAEPVRMTHEEFYADGYEEGRPVPIIGNGPDGDRPPPGAG